MKKILAVGLSGVMAMSVCGALAGCGGNDNTLTIWSFTDEIQDIVEKFKEDMQPDYEIKVTLASTASHHSKLTQALRSGNAPDIFTVEYAYARNFVNSGMLMSLSKDGFDMEEQAREELYEYTVDFMTDDGGTLRALSWQATPGAFFVRRSTAEQYFSCCVDSSTGELDLDKLQEDHFSTYEKFMESTEYLYNESDGDVKILSGLDDARRIFLSNREVGWIDDSGDQTQLVIEDQVLQYMQMAEFLQGGQTTEKYINGSTEQQESWFNDMANPNVFGYFLPTWGLHYYLKQHADNGNGYDATGDWAVIKGPQTFVDGGTWIAVNARTDMTEEAKEFLNYVIFNRDFLRWWAQSTGDFLSNKQIVNEIKDTYSEPFLDGQNHYAFFADIVDDISVDYVSAYDSALDGMFKEQVVFYARGEKTAADALQTFVDNTRSNYAEWGYPSTDEIAQLAAKVGTFFQGGTAAVSAKIVKEN